MASSRLKGTHKFILVMALSLTLAACGNIGKDDQQLLNDAAVHLEQGDVNAAIIELKNILQRHPDNAEARYRLASIYLNYHDFSSAEKEFRHAANAGWNPAEACYGLTRSLLGRGKLDDMLTVCSIDKAFPVDKQAELTALHATALAGKNKQYEALQKLQLAEQLQADASQVLQTRIEFLLLDGKLTEADKVIAHALELYPDSRVFVLQKAARLVQEGDNTAASELFQSVIDRDPPGHITGYGRRARLTLARLMITTLDFQAANKLIKPLYGKDPETSYLGGLIAYRESDYDLAEQRILKVLKQAPDYQPAMLLYGAINYSQEDYEQATYYLSKYVAAVPENLGARKLLSQAHMKLGQFGEARDSLVTALNADTTDAELLALVGVNELRSGNNKAGLINLEQAVAASPDSIRLRGELARAYLETGDVERAIEELQTILQGDDHPQEAEILLTLALLRAGKTTEAAATSSSLLEESPSDPALLTLAASVQEANGDTQAAHTHYTRALKLAPDYTPATMLLGRFEEQSGNIDKAITLYRAGVKSSPKDTRPILALARIAEVNGDIDTMVNWLQKARERDDNELTARMILGEYYLQQKDYKEVTLLIKEAATIDSVNPGILLLSARLAMAQGQIEDSLKPLNELQRIRPDSPVVRALLGENLLRLGRYNEARDHIKIVLESYPKSREALVLSAELELRSGNIDKALNAGKQLQEIAPDAAVGYEVAGNVWMLKKNYPQASKAFNAAWKLQPTSSLAIKLSESLKNENLLTESVIPLQDWLKQHPDNLAVRQVLATAWMGLGENIKAINNYIQVLDKSPDSLIALNNLAWLYQLEDNPLALETARRAHQTNSNDPGVMDTYGWILVQHDDPEQGRALLAEALQQLPDIADVQYHYAVALLRTGETVEGVKLLEKILANEQSFNGRKEAQQLLDKHRGESS